MRHSGKTFVHGTGVTHTLDSGSSNLGDYETEVYHRKRLHGGVVDAVVGIYDFRNRWLRPDEGTWMSRDPLGVIDTWNLYQSFTSKPLARIDVYGLCVECAPTHTLTETGLTKVGAAFRSDEENMAMVGNPSLEVEEEKKGRRCVTSGVSRPCSWRIRFSYRVMLPNNGRPHAQNRGSEMKWLATGTSNTSGSQPMPRGDNPDEVAESRTETIDGQLSGYRRFRIQADCGKSSVLIVTVNNAMGEVLWMAGLRLSCNDPAPNWPPVTNSEVGGSQRGMIQASS